MAQWSNVHLMFCEGPHDAAFLKRLITKNLNFEGIQIKISELPYPVSNVLQQSFKKRASDDLRLDLAKKFFLPDYLVKRDSVLVMIFNYGGSNRAANMSSFLENLFPLLQQTTFAGLDQPGNQVKYAYTIFADADVLGLEGARDQISSDLATIDGSAWLKSGWAKLTDTKAVTQKTDFGDAAAYIWKKSTEDNGTLEDIVLECLSGDAGLEQTLQFLDTRFNWASPTGATRAQICASAAKRLKAAFCVEGQYKKPGGSLSVILDQADLLNPDIMNKSVAVQDCLAFLRAWII